MFEYYAPVQGVVDEIAPAPSEIFHSSAFKLLAQTIKNKMNTDIRFDIDIVKPQF